MEQGKELSNSVVSAGVQLHPNPVRSSGVVSVGRKRVNCKILTSFSPYPLLPLTSVDGIWRLGWLSLAKDNRRIDAQDQ